MVLILNRRGLINRQYIDFVLHKVTTRDPSINKVTSIDNFANCGVAELLRTVSFFPLVFGRWTGLLGGFLYDNTVALGVLCRFSLLGRRVPQFTHFLLRPLFHDVSEILIARSGA